MARGLTLTDSYRDRPQEDIHKAVCDLTDKIRAKRNAKGYGEQAELQRLRRQRSELQALLTKPTLVWINPNEPIGPGNPNPCCEQIV